jgi:hypothetical protein
MLKDNILDIALRADFETTIVLLNTFKFLSQLKNFWQLKHDYYTMQFDNVTRVDKVSTDRAKSYWNSNQDMTVFKQTLTNVHDMLTVAAKYEGKVFGGFVRNVLIPHAFNKPVSGYKDVDLWFTSETYATKFINDMAKQLYKLPELCYNDNKDIYDFDRQQYLLIGENMEDLYIDIIVSPHGVPVNDFHVNQLCYNITAGFTSYGDYPTHMVLYAIMNKKTHVLPTYSCYSYIDDIIKNKHSNIYNYPYRNRGDLEQLPRIYKLLNTGWKITY